MDHDEKDAVNTVNAILKYLNVPIQITNLRQCVASLWVALFEGLFQTRLPDVIRNTTKRDAKIHNIQVILNHLAIDVLNDDLLHIDAGDIVDAEKSDILDLIEIFGELASSIGGKEYLKLKQDAIMQDDAEISSILDETGNISDSFSLEGDDDFFEDSKEILPRDNQIRKSQLDTTIHSHRKSKRSNSMLDSSVDTVTLRRSKRRKTPSGVVNDIDEFLKIHPEASIPSYPKKNQSTLGSTTLVNETVKSSSPTKTKKLKFNFDDYTSVKSKIPDDTSTARIRALQFSSQRLTQEKNVLNARIMDDENTIRNELKRLDRNSSNTVRSKKTTTTTSGRGTSNLKSSKKVPQSRESIEPDITLSKDASKEIQENVDISNPPVENLKKFDELIENALPGIDIPKRYQRMAWNGQVNIWKRAIKEREWERKVREHKKRNLDPTALKRVDSIRKELESDIRMTRQKTKTAAEQRFKSELRDRKVAISKLNHERKRIEQEAEARKMKSKFKDEDIACDLYKKYTSATRSAILEARRSLQEKSKIIESRQHLHRIAKENYYRDQVNLLKEELNEAKREYEIVEKEKRRAQVDVERELRSGLRKEIITARKVLSTIDEDFDFRKQDADLLKENIQFQVRSKH